MGYSITFVRNIFHKTIIIMNFLILWGIGIFMHNLHFSIAENKKITALILARGGSKGIPLKNIATIGNETLLGRSLRIIENVEKFESIFVSTDHQLIMQETLKCKILT